MSILTLALAILIILLGFTAFTGAPYVPSKPSDVKKSLKDLYKLSSKDTLLDLGAGDGIVLKLATARGAKAIGLELNPVFAALAKFRLRKNQKAKIKCCNFYNYSFPPETTVIYAFADTRDILKIYRKIQQESRRLKKPLYLISYAFEVPNQKPLKSLGPHRLYKIT